jgi:lysozyme
MMDMSAKGLMALAASEGVVDTYYLDSVGVPTFGIGHTKAAGFPDPLDWKGRQAELEFVFQLFKEDVKEYEEMVERNVKVPLRQNQFDALVHFVYNVGEGNFRKSKLLKALNSGNFKWAGEHGFHGWLKPRGLKSRRDKESKMFLTGYYGPSEAALYTATSSGKLRYVRQIDLSPYFKDNLPPAPICSG